MINKRQYLCKIKELEKVNTHVRHQVMIFLEIQIRNK